MTATRARHRLLAGKPCDLGRCALLAIDLQRYFLEPGAAAYLPRARRIIPHVVSLLEAYRHADLPVVFTRHAHRRGDPAGQMGQWWDGKLPREGDPASALIPEIAPRHGEWLLTKTRYSAFEGTTLETRLRRRGVEAVVLCGVMTNCCVETTARHAFMKDFRVIVAANACAANSEAHHRASLLNLSYAFAAVADTKAIIAALRAAHGS